MSRISIPGGGLPPFYPDATLALDFVNGAYRVGAGGSSRPDFASLANLTVTRATPAVTWDTTGTYSFAANTARIVPGVGLLVEEARTNLFLNSFAPATQNVTITAASHTITVWGTGSVTVAAGTATISNAGAASAGSPRTIGCTAGGTISVTVTGSPSIVQVEAGAVGTSPIPTPGSAVLRSADVVKITGIAIGFPYTLFGQFQIPTIVAGNVDLASTGPDGNNLQGLYLPGGAAFGYAINGGVTSALVNSGFAATAGIAFRAAARFNTNDVNASAGGLKGTADTSTAPVAMTQLNVGNSISFGGSSPNGYIQKLVAYPSAYSDAALQALTA